MHGVFLHRLNSPFRLANQLTFYIYIYKKRLCVHMPAFFFLLHFFIGFLHSYLRYIEIQLICISLLGQESTFFFGLERL